MQSVTLLTLALATCAQPAPLPTFVVEPERYWLPPTADVYLSSEMSPECRASAYQAVQLVRRRGVLATPVWVEEDHPALALEPRYGEVAIKAGLPRDDRFDAEVLLWQFGEGVTAADIVLGNCDRQVAVAELARVFGLEVSR